MNVLRRGLLEEHYAVDIAYDGEEGLEKFDINEHDLIILDLMIPKIDGLYEGFSNKELIQTIRGAGYIMKVM